MLQGAGKGFTVVNNVLSLRSELFIIGFRFVGLPALKLVRKKNGRETFYPAVR